MSDRRVLRQKLNLSATGIPAKQKSMYLLSLNYILWKNTYIITVLWLLSTAK
jgi:hypothetical protein